MNLELLHSFFPEVSIKANARFDAAGRNDGTTLRANFSMGPTEKDPKVAYAQLRILTVDEECENEPYNISVTGFALLACADGTPVDTEDPAIRRTAAQALVGSARELICIVTARGPFPGFGIGFIPFGKIRGIDANEDEDDDPPPAAKKGVRVSKVAASRVKSSSIKQGKVTSK